MCELTPTEIVEQIPSTGGNAMFPAETEIAGTTLELTFLASTREDVNDIRRKLRDEFPGLLADDVQSKIRCGTTTMTMTISL